MKRSIKVMLSTFAISAISLFGVFGASCSAVDWVEQQINQLTCSHENGVYQTEYVAATCTEDGMTEGTKCVDCDAWITKGDVLKATGHKEVIIEGKAATCLENGKTDGKECETCGEVLKEQKVIKALGHKIQFIDAKAPTLFESGYTSGQGCVNCGTVYSGLVELNVEGFEESSYNVVSHDGIVDIHNKIFAFNKNATPFMTDLKVKEEGSYVRVVTGDGDSVSLGFDDGIPYLMVGPEQVFYNREGELINFFNVAEIDGKIYFSFIEGTYELLTDKGVSYGTLVISADLYVDIESMGDCGLMVYTPKK